MEAVYIYKGRKGEGEEGKGGRGVGEEGRGEGGERGGRRERHMPALRVCGVLKLYSLH